MENELYKDAAIVKEMNDLQKSENYNRLFNELKNKNAILFYKVKEGGSLLTYGCFSNFSPHSFVEDNLIYKTSEHYYQANKFEYKSKDYMDATSSFSAFDTAKIGRDRSRPMRKDWDIAQIKAGVMLHALKLKFDQNEDIKKILLSTGTKYLVEDSPIDWCWGCGADRTGENFLGRCLMILRDFYNGKSNVDYIASFNNEYHPVTNNYRS